LSAGVAEGEADALEDADGVAAGFD